MSINKVKYFFIKYYTNFSYCPAAIVEHDIMFIRSTYEVLQILEISLLDMTLIELFNHAENNDVNELLYNQQLSLNFSGQSLLNIIK